MAGREFTCGFNGCRRVVAVSGERCWQHKGMSATGLDARYGEFTFDDYVARQRVERAMSRNPQFRTKLSSPPEMLGEDGEIIARGNLYESHLGVDQDTIDTVYEAARQCGGGKDFSQTEKLDAIRSGAFQKFQGLLKEQLGEERISTLEVRGMSIPHYRESMSAPSASYMATVIDFGKDTECLVDPFSEILVQVKDGQPTVTKASPIRDNVCVGSINEFIDGEVTWHSATLHTPDGQTIDLDELGKIQAAENLNDI